MHDNLEYFSLDPVHRKHHQNKITFGLVYAFHENFVLVLSHDEIVHGKKSLIDKMPGDDWQRFANLRRITSYNVCYTKLLRLTETAKHGHEDPEEHTGTRSETIRIVRWNATWPPPVVRLSFLV